MGFIQKIIDFIMNLLGLKPSAPALSAGDRAQNQDSAVQGMDQQGDAENADVDDTDDDARVIRSVPGADLIEEDGEALWVCRIDGDVPDAQWQDDWGPIGGPSETALDDFMYHQYEFDELMQQDAEAAASKLESFGYEHVGQYFRVRFTVLRQYGTPHGPNVGDRVFDSQAIASAAIKAQRRRLDEQGAAMIAANPELMAPIEGITMEVYAQMSAMQAQGMDQAAFQAHVGEHGLDLPAWERVAAGWMDRMSKDTTATLSTIYGKAFQGAGQGQFGAAAAANAATGYDGTAAAGAEPMPFDKVCEIQGATTAWSNTGQDVNAMLQSTFQMNAAEWAAANSWWLSQLMADLPRFEEYNKKVEAYEKQYMGGAGGAAPDSDLSF